MGGWVCRLVCHCAKLDLATAVGHEAEQPMNRFVIHQVLNDRNPDILQIENMGH